MISDYTTVQLVWFFYTYGVVVYFFSLVESTAQVDIIASFILGVFWPVLLPARILKKFLHE